MARRRGGQKQGTVPSWVIPGWGGSQEEASESRRPCPEARAGWPPPARGARLSPPHQHSLHSPGLSPGAPGSIPLERRLMDLSPQCHPARPAPHTRGVICFHREHCPSASPARLRAGRAGRAGLRSCFLHRTNDLGPGAGTAWREFKQPGPGSPGLAAPLPQASQSKSAWGQFQIKLDPWELLVGDPKPPKVSSFQVTLYLLPKKPAPLPPGGCLAEGDKARVEGPTLLGAHRSLAASWPGDLGQLVLLCTFWKP